MTKRAAIALSRLKGNIAVPALGWLGIMLVVVLARGASPEARANESAAAAPVLAKDVEAVLRKHCLGVWYPRALDASGGFFCSFDREWRRREKQPKTLVFQARMTLVAAQVALRRPDLTDEYRGYARHGVDFLLRLRDDEDGGFFWSTDPALLRKQAKHAYGMAYAIYALAAASEALGDDALRDRASEGFLWLERHAYDRECRGYFGALERGGGPIMARPEGAPPVDSTGTPYGAKSMATQLHLLEAYTELLRVWPDPRLRTRMEDLLDLLLTKVFVRPDSPHTNFTVDWRPLPSPMSCGHDVEAAFLLVEAVSVLGRPDDSRVWRTARALVDHALQAGWDTGHGGLFNEGAAQIGPGERSSKLWWAQAENLNALLMMHERFGGETSVYWERFVEQWRFISAHCVDHEFGGWYWEVAADGTPLAGESTLKGSSWKATYHETRSLFAVQDRLRRLGESVP